jgi:hypothetical protein
MIILLMVGTMKTSTTWLRSNITMGRRGRDDVVGKHKAILDLADAISTQITQLGADTKHITEFEESDLHRNIKEDLRGGHNRIHRRLRG